MIDSAGILPKRLFEQGKGEKVSCPEKAFEFKGGLCPVPELIDDWKSRQGSADYRNATPMMRKCLVMAVNEDLTPLLERIKQDTLLIWGDLDTATPLGDGKLMEEKIPSSGLAVLKGTGHFSFLEQPGTFRNIMRAYFQPVNG